MKVRIDPQTGMPVFVDEDRQSNIFAAAPIIDQTKFVLKAGDTMTGGLVMTNTVNGFSSGSISSLLRFSGGTVGDGATIVIGGSTHASIPNIGVLRISGTTEIMRWDTNGITLSDAKNIILGSTTGTKIGTSTTQKLSFFNSTPVSQRGATVDLGTVLSELGLRAAGTAYPITTSGAINFTSTSITLGVSRSFTTTAVTNAPVNMTKINMNGKGIIDSIAAYAGQRDYFYLANKKSEFTITSVNCTGVNNLFNGITSSDVNIPIATLSSSPCVITIETTSNIEFSDVLDLVITGHRLTANGATLTDWMVETKGSDNNWYTVLNRTGVSDSIGTLSVPLHVIGVTYPDSEPNEWHAIRGIRITISGATAVSYSAGNLQFSSLQLRESRPGNRPAIALGALDIDGGTTYGDLVFNNPSTLSSGTTYGVQINPTYTHSGTAGYTSLRVNATETSIGSGTKNLFDLLVGGTSKFKVSNTGKITSALAQTYTESNVTTDRVYNADITTIDELADVVGSLIADLRAVGVVN